MNKAWLRLAELVALTGLAAGVVYATIAIIGKGESSDIAIGGLMTVLPIIVNAIRNISSSQVMNTMADHLAASRPDAKESG